MDQFAALTAFAAVVETGGFTQAAARLGQSKSAISRMVGQLEAHLGARLLQRTTRKLSPTDVGRAYYQRARNILDDLSEASDAAGLHQSGPRGLLRLTAPLSFGALHLTPALPDFISMYPEVEIEVSLSDRFVNLIEDGFDVAVRIGRPADSSLIAKRIAPIRRALCAAPDYINRCGAPTAPEDLSEHACLSHLSMGAEEWRFSDAGGGVKNIRVSGRCRADNGDVLRGMALAGMGIVYLPTFFVGEDIRTGRLESLLAEYIPSDTAMYGLYPHSRHLSAKVRAFLDFLTQRFGPIPPWDL